MNGSGDALGAIDASWVGAKTSIRKRNKCRSSPNAETAGCVLANSAARGPGASGGTLEARIAWVAPNSAIMTKSSLG